MKIEFDTTPDETGKGRIVVDGRYFGLPVEAVAQFKLMQDTLERMTATEVCDCGCPWKCKPKLGKPLEYFFAAQHALGISHYDDKGEPE